MKQQIVRMEPFHSEGKVTGINSIQITVYGKNTKGNSVKVTMDFDYSTFFHFVAATCHNGIKRMRDRFRQETMAIDRYILSKNQPTPTLDVSVQTARKAI